MVKSFPVLVGHGEVRKTKIWVIVDEGTLLTHSALALAMVCAFHAVLKALVEGQEKRVMVTGIYNFFSVLGDHLYSFSGSSIFVLSLGVVSDVTYCQ